ncbi:MAG: hypothetical protein IPK80_28585 [Nannocystis sp.]|nr:hypothetical protein [Nannocystis sp.]
MGLIGVGGGLFLKTLTFRNTLNLGGLMFSAGAVLASPWCRDLRGDAMAMRLFFKDTSCTRSRSLDSR